MTKFLEFSELAEVPSSDDVLILIDVSDTTHSTDGTTKYVLYGNVSSAGGGAGNTRVQMLKELPPATSAASYGAITGAATPAELVPVWSFADAADSYLDYLCKLGDSYGGNGLTFTIAWAGDAATTGKVVWGLAIRAIPDDAEDINTTAHSYDFNYGAFTTASAAGELDYATITFTNGADMDSLAAGSFFILRVHRDGDHVSSDTMTDEAQLVAISGVETPA